MNDNTNLPVSWDEEMAKHAKAAAEAERPRLASISLRGGIMQYEKVPIPGNKLPCIIIASIMERTFYKERFNPDKPASPVCFAFHDGTDGVPWLPHAEVAERQHEECATCPRNAWGSDLNGGRGKACKDRRKLALLPGAKAKEMALLSVPVMSVKNWANYVNTVAAQARRPPWGVVTEISVTPDPKSQFKVNFEFLELVPEEDLSEIYKKIEMAKQVLTTPYDVNNPQENMGQPNSGPVKDRKF